MKKILQTLIILAAFLLLDSCAKNPVTGKRDLMLLSESQEIAMGQQSDPDIIKFFGLYDDKNLQKFIEEKGQQMAAISHRKDLKYEFKIVDSPVVNAFAVPGGYVYFTRGIMAHFNNEAEFAGVLGHEIGHITARHSAKQYSNAMLAQIGLVAGMALAPEFAQFADLAQNGIGLLFLKFGRDAESQSDKLGVEYSTKINYDAHEMAGFFQTLDRLQSQSGGEEVPTFLSTHPDPADRENKVAKLADDWKRKTKSTTLKVNRESYLKMIDGIIYGEDPKQGFVENNIFYHPGLKFQFPIPQQWSIQNTPEQVQLASKDGKAMMLFTFAPGQSLEAAAEALLKNYQLTLVESQKNNVNGLPVIAMVADQTSQEQQSLRTLIYVIEHGKNIYAMIGVTSIPLFNSFAPTFKASMQNFNTLSDPSKINKQPERIRIKTIKQNASLSEALRSLGTNEKRLEEVAILNGMQLTDRVDKGMLIKVID
ncbi:M48 family metalloprotease [Chryseolinea sp. H1M3-3]|uniref:M48 family metalloprotease n=1 Tax=Chryseolinea sp. H1M3-3 TaxID=3034144 RepID=UPI0023ED6285|nr:M48 family metalloprotease [Chryseolinea sp. H1M3-3]